MNYGLVTNTKELCIIPKLRPTANNVAIQVKSSGSSPTLQSKSVTSGSSAQTVYPDSGYDGLYSVQIYPSILQN